MSWDTVTVHFHSVSLGLYKIDQMLQIRNQEVLEAVSVVEWECIPSVEQKDFSKLERLEAEPLSVISKLERKAVEWVQWVLQWLAS